MSELKRISPILDNFNVGGSISEHDGVRCYPAMRTESDEKYIVKTVSIPASQTQLDALLLTGAFPDATSALEYFKEQADRTVDELEILRRLSEYEGFLPYESWQVSTMDDGIGFEVFMLSSYKRTLRKHLQHQPMTHLGAINLGLDLCGALAVCRRSGYLYVDLKPNNIYVVDDHQFRIGDLGFLPLNSLAYASLPDRYRSEYTAPEIQDAFATLNTTLDIYALGTILYQIYNGGELPAVAEGEDKFPAPLNADYELAEIILKACDPNPEARWQDPIQMGQALVSYMQRVGANDTPIVPPVIPAFVSESEISDEDLDLTGIDLTDIPDIEDFVPEYDEDIVDEVLAADELPEEVEAPAEESEAEVIAAVEVSPEEVNESFEDDAALPTEVTAEEETIEEVPVEDNSEAPIIADFVEDETSPENNITKVEYDEVSDELNEILAQVDELASHPVPEPVVAPEPIEVQLPVEEESAENEAHVEEDSNDDTSLGATVMIPSTEDESSEEDPVQEITDEVTSEDDHDEDEPIKKRSVLTWVLYGVIALLVISIITVGLFYYRNVYLLPIDDLQVTGDESSMVIQLDSNIDESLLSVVCSDSHGNQVFAPVVNGTATFANLSPDTAYNVQIVVDGFHRLVGETAVTYSTPAQTNIVQFNAVTGTEDGSVILGFTVEGPDNDNWSVAYSAEGEETQTVELLSHLVTLSGLTIGKEYTFTLIPAEDMYVTGLTEIKFTASKIVYPQNVNIVSCLDGKMVVEWDAPEDATVSEWTVRCYNDAEYNETVITTDTSAVFENIDPTYSYTVDVTAAGMSVSQRAYMADNAITVSDFQVVSSVNQLILTWTSSDPVPEDGWVLLYTVDNSGIQSSIVCTDNKAVISPIVPNSTYSFALQETNGNAVLTEPLTYQTAKAQDFSGYGMIRSSMTYKLCKTPDNADWVHSDISDSDYKNTFQSGENISVVGQLHDTYGISDDSIVTMYVFRDVDGNVASYSYTVATWNDMWAKTYGEFDIPLAPTAAGDYTLNIYFNGKLVTAKNITITE